MRRSYHRTNPVTFLASHRRGRVAGPAGDRPFRPATSRSGGGTRAAHRGSLRNWPVVPVTTEQSRILRFRPARGRGTPSWPRPPAAAAHSLRGPAAATGVSPGTQTSRSPPEAPPLIVSLVTPGTGRRSPRLRPMASGRAPKQPEQWLDHVGDSVQHVLNSVRLMAMPPSRHQRLRGPPARSPGTHRGTALRSDSLTEWDPVV